MIPVSLSSDEEPLTGLKRSRSSERKQSAEPKKQAKKQAPVTPSASETSAAVTPSGSVTQSASGTPPPLPSSPSPSSSSLTFTPPSSLSSSAAAGSKRSQSSQRKDAANPTKQTAKLKQGGRHGKERKVRSGGGDRSPVLGDTSNDEVNQHGSVNQEAYQSREREPLKGALFDLVTTCSELEQVVKEIRMLLTQAMN